jgi:hypothetical protein
LVIARVRLARAAFVEEPMRTFACLILFAAALAAGTTAPARVWDGYDASSGADVTIEGGNLVRRGETIEVYDWDAGTYRDLEVVDVARLGGSVEVETFDYETGDYGTLEMED